MDNAAQANLLAATDDASAKNRVYNVAFGQRTTLVELHEIIREGHGQRTPNLNGTPPMYSDFRVGDIRHSLADIEKAANLLGYTAAFDIREGLVHTLDRYVENALSRGIKLSGIHSRHLRSS